MTTIQFVYMTAGSKAEAQEIASALVELRLAACVNIIAGMTSLYHWDGRVQEDQEVVLIAKTTSQKVEALKEKVKSIHSYECPCIVCLPVADGHEPFLRWIREQTDSN